MQIIIFRDGNVVFFISTCLDTPNVKTLQKLDLINFYLEQCTELFWLFMELHVKKLVLLFIVLVSLTEVSKFHVYSPYFTKKWKQ